MARRVHGHRLALAGLIGLAPLDEQTAAAAVPQHQGDVHHALAIAPPGQPGSYQDGLNCVIQQRR